MFYKFASTSDIINMAYERKNPITDSDKIRLQQIGKRIIELRKRTGLTVEFFCGKNLIPRISYSALERGTNFHMTTLLKVLHVHDISLEEFFKGIQ